MTKFSKYLSRPSAPIPTDHLDIIQSNSEMSSTSALSRKHINQLFEPGYLSGENGYCRLPSGAIHTAVLTKMPKVSIDMLDWWFWWHAAEGIRYQIWYPEMHYDIEADFGGHYDDDSMTHRERLHGSAHLVTEDVGMGKDKILIDFMSPADFGFDKSKLDESKNTIICARVGSPKMGLSFVDMCHFVRVTDGGGVEIRSRFWMGHNITKESGFAQKTISKLLNYPLIKRKLIPVKAGSSMFHHCTQEYHNLASFLPELYMEESGNSIK